MEMLNILWPLTSDTKVSDGHQMGFYGSMFTVICVQYIVVQTVRHKELSFGVRLLHGSLFPSTLLRSKLICIYETRQQ